MSTLDDFIRYCVDALGITSTVKYELVRYSTHVDKEGDVWTVYLKYNQRKEERLFSVAHECVHIKQMEDGRLKDTTWSVVWCGECMNPSGYRQPWEDEANSKGFELVKEFMEGGK